MHLLFSSNENVSIRINEYDIRNSVCEKLLGVKFENKLNFEDHIVDISSKVSHKTYALARVAPHMNLS